MARHKVNLASLSPIWTVAIRSRIGAGALFALSIALGRLALLPRADVSGALDAAHAAPAPAAGRVPERSAILQQLADRLGSGPDMPGSPAYWIDQLATTFRHQNISRVSLAPRTEGFGRKARRACCGPMADGRFKTPSGRFVFPPTLDDDPLIPPAEFPLHLIALPSERCP